MTKETLNSEQASLLEDFGGRVLLDPQAAALKYLDQFSQTLSVRLACELSNTYSQSDYSRGYYRPAILEPSRLIIRHAWEILLATAKNKRPIVIIAGGVEGSGKHSTISRPLQALRKEISFIYEATS